VPSADHLSTIRSEGQRLLACARRDPVRPVPQYPGWALTDLVSHTASVHARTIVICHELPEERPALPQPPEGADIIEWGETTLEEMIDTLEAADPETRVWGFWPSPSIGLWERRMVVETGLHRWDGEQAFDEEGALTEDVAVAGLEEFGDMWLARLGEMPLLEVVAHDLERSWDYGTGSTAGRVEGTASDLYLRLMSRPSSVTLPAELAAGVDALDGPSKP